MKIILRLLVFVLGHWYMLVLAFLCLITATIFAIAIPRMLGEGIDTVLGKGERSFVIIAAVVIIAASALRGLAGYGQRYFNEVLAQKASYIIRNTLYERIQRLSFAFHDRSQTGQLMSRATVDVEAIRMFFAMGLLGMAQVLLHEPDVLIMDEPTAGLDPNQIRQVRRTIRELGQNKTVLLSTHILQEVEAVADRVIFINRGSIVFDGTPEEMRAGWPSLDEAFRVLTEAEPCASPGA